VKRFSENPKVKVSIGVPLWKEGLHPAWVSRFIETITNLPFQTEYIFDRTIGIHRARTNIVKHSSGEYIFFLDSDVICPQDTILKLIEDGKDIVSALYYKAQFPHNPQMYIKVGDYKYAPVVEFSEGLVEVDGIGLGACLIKKSVFDKIPEPWFDLPVNSELSEDLFFCNKAKEHGFKIYVDTRIKCGHVSEVIITEEYFNLIKPYLIKR